MKKYFTLILILSIYATTILAQAKKYALVEHFTNTWCSTCASQNPGFYQRVNIESNAKIHHISIHSSVPYPQCPFYQANKTEQDARKDFYGLFSTPRVSLNGAPLVSAGDVTGASIDAAAAGTSPLDIKVTETTGTNRTATVTFKAVGTIPVANYKMYAAIVEKKINFAGQNGETIHHNVLRKYIPYAGELGQNGFDVNPSTTAQSINLTYTLGTGWDASQTYVVVWIQNATTKEVLNSATKFDATSATPELSTDAFVHVSPNPTSGKIALSFSEVTPQYLSIQNALGQVLETRVLVNNSPIELNLSQFAKGIVFVAVKSKEGTAVKKVVVE
ncbi:MAG: Omp28-related outer membrane protein [Saprospiraceae bacterium]|nr:Omp28-related outer membrane protein [Saprospiraceae bacterium]